MLSNIDNTCGGSLRLRLFTLETYSDLLRPCLDHALKLKGKSTLKFIFDMLLEMTS